MSERGSFEHLKGDLTPDVAREILPGYARDLVRVLRDPSQDPFEVMRESFSAWRGEWGQTYFGRLFSDDPEKEGEWELMQIALAEYAVVALKNQASEFHLNQGTVAPPEVAQDAQRRQYWEMLSARNIGVVTADQATNPMRFRQMVAKVCNGGKGVEMLTEACEQAFAVDSAGQLMQDPERRKAFVRATARLLAHGLVWTTADVTREEWPRMIGTGKHVLRRQRTYSEVGGLELQELFLLTRSEEMAAWSLGKMFTFGFGEYWREPLEIIKVRTEAFEEAVRSRT